MLTIDNLYHLIKPLNNEGKITAYPLIIGGGGAGVTNLSKGVWILRPLRSNLLTKGVYGAFSAGGVDKANGASVLKSDFSALVQTDYQLDFFIKPSSKAASLAPFEEAEKMRLYLSSIDAIMYLRGLNAEIIPALREVQYFSEYGEQKLLYNRALLEFSIVSESSYNQDFFAFDNAKITGGYIAQDGEIKSKTCNH